MTLYHRVFLCAVVIVLMVTAGCTFSQNTAGAPPLATREETTAAPPVPSTPVPAATTQPGAAGTQPPGTCTADVNSDPANCGGCGYACPANAICQQGQCFCAEGYAAQDNQCVAVPSGGGTITETGCPAGMTPCPDGYCYDLTSASDNCGICGNTCPAGMVCSASTCTVVPTEATTAPTTTVTTTTTTSSGGGSGLGGGFGIFCAKPLTKCPSGCVNLATDESNCGACKHTCLFTKSNTCCDGTCVNLQTNSSNCGSCGHKCLVFGSVCEFGTCKSKVVIGSGLSKDLVAPTLAKIVDPRIIVGPIGPGI